MWGINTKTSRVTLVALIAYAVMAFFAMTSLGGGDSSSIGTFAVLVTVILGVYYALNNTNSIVASKSSRSWIGWILWMILMSTVHMFWTHGIASILHPIYCPCSFLLFYCLATYDDYSEKLTAVVFSLLLVVFAYWCYKFSYTMSLDYNKEFAGFNLVYWPLCCMPFIFLLDNKKLQYVLLLVIVFVVLYCQKRSSTIIILSVAAMMLFDKGTSTRRGWIILIAIIATYFVAQYFMSAYLDNIAYRMRTINEDQGSGRIVLWADVFNALSDNNIIEWIFGRGQGSITQTSHSNAHNDALQLLFEYGIIGFVFYFSFVVRSIKETIRLRRNGSKYFMGYFTCTITIIVMGAVSDLFVFYSYFAFLCAYMGMAEALSAKEENLIIE